MGCYNSFSILNYIYDYIFLEGIDMITLDYFLQDEKIVENKNISKSKIFESKTKREYTEKDLPYEIRKDIKAWIKKIELMELTADQKKLLELIKEGAKIKIEKGKKKEIIEILKPYPPYLIIQLNNSIRRNKK